MDSDNANQSSPTLVEVGIGESGKKFSERYSGFVKADHQPAGLSFYKASWSTKNKGRVRIAHKSHSIELSDVLNVMGTEDNSARQTGIFNISIYCGISGLTGILHSDALDRFGGLLKTIRAAGWRSTVPYGVPRLYGKDMLRYHFESGDATTLGSDYIPSLREWMALDDQTTWEFYADGIFLNVTFMRDREKMNLKKPGSYVFQISLSSDEAYFADFAGPENRQDWRSKVPNELRKLEERRSQLEAEWSKKGMRINEAYRDPPIPNVTSGN